MTFGREISSTWGENTTATLRPAISAMGGSNAGASNRVRARIEHPFGVIKHLWGYSKVRYRGLAKNGAQVFTFDRIRDFIKKSELDQRFLY